MNTSPSKLIPTLTVPDLLTARACYEAIGFGFDWWWPDENPSHAGLSFNADVSIMLAAYAGSYGGSGESTDRLYASDPVIMYRSRVLLYRRVD